MIEALTLLLSGVTLALQRRDKAQEAAAFDEDQLYADLLDLHDAAHDWLYKAGATNEQVRRWISQGMPDEAPEDFHRTVLGQALSMEHVVFGLEQSTGVLHKVLTLYAPDVETDLSDVLRRRSPLIHDLSEELQRVKAAPPAEVDRLAAELEGQVQDLAGAVERLGEFIRNMRPLRQQ